MTGEEEKEQPERESSEAEDDADAGDEESEEERENRELEQEVGELGRQILEHRRSIPDRFVETLADRLVGLRPVLPPPAALASEIGVVVRPGSEMQEESEFLDESSIAETDRGILEKLCIFQAKSASNFAAMPVILKRLNDCIAMVEKVDGYSVAVDPVFKRSRKR